MKFGFRSLALLLAGAVIGILGSLLVGRMGFSYALIRALVAIFVLLLVLGTNTDSRIIHVYHLLKRKNNLKSMH